MAQSNPSEQPIEERIVELDRAIDRLKILYEQYFMGIMKVAPRQPHKDVERKMRELSREQVRNTGHRFRITRLTQKLGSYNTYWKRILREIDQGRYVRDVARATRRAGRAGADMPEEVLAGLPRLLRDRILRERAKLASRADRKAARPEPKGEVASQLPAGMTEAEARALHESYLNARKVVGKGAVSYEAFLGAVGRHAARLREAQGQRGPLKLAVAIKGDRVLLRARAAK